MSFTIDGKSAALGAFAAAALFAGAGAMQAAGSGRYQMETESVVLEGGSYEYRVFVLDTTTGDVWKANPGQRPAGGN